VIPALIGRSAGKEKTDGQAQLSGNDQDEYKFNPETSLGACRSNYQVSGQVEHLVLITAQKQKKTGRVLSSANR
jgi:hypothetical protein